MPINPMTVSAGAELHFHGKLVTVLAAHRFWTPDGRLIAGSVILQGEPTANDPRDLIAFCKQARRPRK